MTLTNIAYAIRQADTKEWYVGPKRTSYFAGDAPQLFITSANAQARADNLLLYGGQDLEVVRVRISTEAICSTHRPTEDD